MRLRNKIGLVIGVLVAVFSLGRCRRAPHSPKVSATAVLPKADKEQVIVDPFHHTIHIITQQGIEQMTLPDHSSKIDVLKDGSVKITASQFGVELRPYLGVGFTLRSGTVMYGTDLLYWKKLDLGVGLSIPPGQIRDAGIFLGVSYNIYSNTSIVLGIDNRQAPIVGIKVRL